MDTLWRLSIKGEKEMARPTDYIEEFDQLLIDHMAEGFTFASFAGREEVRCCTDTLYNWCTLFPSFSDAKKIGRAAQLFKDEITGFELTTGSKTGSAAYHIFKMKNCHGWKDKTEIQAVTTSMTIEQFIKQQNEKDIKNE